LGRWRFGDGGKGNLLLDLTWRREEKGEERVRGFGFFRVIEDEQRNKVSSPYR